MTNSTTNRHWAARGLVAVCVTVSAIGLAVARPHAAQRNTQPQTARHHGIFVPPVPPKLEVDEPDEVVFVGHAFGTQNYVCLPSGAGVAWSLFTPQATLFSKHGQQLTTHFFSPNPDENGTVIRAAWQHSRDSSTVWAGVVESSTDPNFVAPGAIAWLKLETKGVQEGPFGGDQLTDITFVQRLN